MIDTPLQWFWQLKLRVWNGNTNYEMPRCFFGILSLYFPALRGLFHNAVTSAGYAVLNIRESDEWWIGKLSERNDLRPSEANISKFDWREWETPQETFWIGSYPAKIRNRRSPFTSVEPLSQLPESVLLFCFYIVALQAWYFDTQFQGYTEIKLACGIL